MSDEADQTGVVYYRAEVVKASSTPKSLYDKWPFIQSIRTQSHFWFVTDITTDSGENLIAVLFLYFSPPSLFLSLLPPQDVQTFSN